ncbi:hypothetical protein GCM10007036_31490 [Alsobacter metallidurans]|uniref:PsiF repeat-containing protein n=1 Tax=Alsobacter metallidurans TaxID=340221 RepID=A0A917IA02_9HYPH|nr:hypothetical protein [Alsobacter metallidurans]GGH24817.1 hypothetical protein GCM10007036_31490 [Alsobacter metallidurans]
MKTSLIAALAVLLAAAAPAAAQTAANPLKKPAPAATAPAAPAPATPAPTAAAPATEKKPPSEAQMASRNRMKECGAEWQAAKKAGKTEGKTWRQFSSECLKKK